MDPIGAVAAISSFVQVTEALQKLLKRLVRYVKTLIHAVSQIASVADQVSGFSRQLIVLEETLGGLPDFLLQPVTRTKVDDYHLGGAWRLVKGLDNLLSSLKPLRGSGSASLLQKMFARFKWLRVKSKVDLFRSSLNSSTWSLNLFVSTVTLIAVSDQYRWALSQRPFGGPGGGRLGRPPGPPFGGPPGRPSAGPSGGSFGAPSDGKEKKKKKKEQEPPQKQTQRSPRSPSTGSNSTGSQWRPPGGPSKGPPGGQSRRSPKGPTGESPGGSAAISSELPSRGKAPDFEDVITHLRQKV